MMKTYNTTCITMDESNEQINLHICFENKSNGCCDIRAYDSKSRYFYANNLDLDYEYIVDLAKQNLLNPIYDVNDKCTKITLCNNAYNNNCILEQINDSELELELEHINDIEQKQLEMIDLQIHQLKNEIEKLEKNKLQHHMFQSNNNKLQNINKNNQFEHILEDFINDCKKLNPKCIRITDKTNSEEPVFIIDVNNNLTYNHLDKQLQFAFNPNNKRFFFTYKFIHFDYVPNADKNLDLHKIIYNVDFDEEYSEFYLKLNNKINILLRTIYNIIISKLHDFELFENLDNSFTNYCDNDTDIYYYRNIKLLDH